MSQESASDRPVATPVTPQTAATPPEPATADPLTGYAAAPPLRSAYPGAAEGGISPVDPVRQPDPDATPGPGYGGPDREPAAPPDGMWMLMPVLVALVLGLGTVVAVSQWPAVITVAVAVVALAAAVLSWPAAGTVRRSVLIAAAGPVGVLIGYWVIRMFQG